MYGIWSPGKVGGNLEKFRDNGGNEGKLGGKKESLMNNLCLREQPLVCETADMTTSAQILRVYWSHAEDFASGQYWWRYGLSPIPPIRGKLGETHLRDHRIGIPSGWRDKYWLSNNKASKNWKRSWIGLGRIGICGFKSRLTIWVIFENLIARATFGLRNGQHDNFCANTKGLSIACRRFRLWSILVEIGSPFTKLIFPGFL